MDFILLKSSKSSPLWTSYWSGYLSVPRGAVKDIKNFNYTCFAYKNPKVPPPIEFETFFSKYWVICKIVIGSIIISAILIFSEFENIFIQRYNIKSFLMHIKNH